MITYQDNGFLGKLKRAIGIRDGFLVCTECQREFFNLVPSEICEPCWYRMTYK